MAAANTTEAVPEWKQPVTPRTLFKVSMVCFLAWVFSVYDYTLFGTLLPKIAEEFGWSTAYATTVSTWVTVGTFIVALSVGPLLDRIGRKKALVVTVLGAALSSGFTGMAFGAVSLVVIRAFSGFGYSEELVNTVYLNEMYGKNRRRGFMYSFVQSGWPVGALLASGLTALMLPVVGWRWTFVIAMVPSILVALIATRLPESPAFAALKEMRRLRSEGKADEADALGKEMGFEVSSQTKPTLRDVFAPGLRLHTTSLSLAWLFNWMAIQVFSVLGTTVLTEAKQVTFDNALLVLVMANAAGFLGYLFHGWLGDRFNRLTVITIGWIVGAIVTAAMLLGPNDAVYVYSLYALSLFFLTGPYAALLFYMGESFPAHVRGLGGNLAHTMGPVGAIAGSALLTILLSAGFSMITAALVAGSACMLASGLVMLGCRRVDQNDTSDPEPSGVVEGAAA